MVMIEFWEESSSGLGKDSFQFTVNYLPVTREGERLKTDNFVTQTKRICNDKLNGIGTPDAEHNNASDISLCA